MHACGLCGLVEIEDSEWKVSSLEFTMRGDNETEGDRDRRVGIFRGFGIENEGIQWERCWISLDKCSRRIRMAISPAPALK